MLLILDEVGYEVPETVGDSVRDEDAVHAGDQGEVIGVQGVPAQPFRGGGGEVVVENGGGGLVLELDDVLEESLESGQGLFDNQSPYSPGDAPGYNLLDDLLNLFGVLFFEMVGE